MRTKRGWLSRWRKLVWFDNGAGGMAHAGFKRRARQGYCTRAKEFTGRLFSAGPKYLAARGKGWLREGGVDVDIGCASSCASAAHGGCICSVFSALAGAFAVACLAPVPVGTWPCRGLAVASQWPRSGLVGLQGGWRHGTFPRRARLRNHSGNVGRHGAHAA